MKLSERDTDEDVLSKAPTFSDSQPATAPMPSTGEFYRPELDGIRAFCIIFTIVNHVPGHPAWINGSVGVDVFFALSG